MPILPSDIQLLESERMRDTADGGGRQTGNIIPSGLAGNVFPKVSRVDSVYGRVNLRKIYVAVRTATLDMYAGAHAIITDPPDNDRISCTLFSTGSSFDTRTAARDHIESYVVAGPLSRMRLYGNQQIGQKAVLTYQREEEPLPDVGEVIVLSVEAAGYPPASQYVRLTDVTHEVRTFTDGNGDFKRRILTLKIGSALSQTFAGAEVTRYATDPSPSKIRITQVADASRYCGIAPLAEEALAGALSLRLASVYAPLVPSTQRETAVSLASVAGAQRFAATATETLTVAATPGGLLGNQTYTARMPTAIQPQSLSLQNSHYLSVDNGAGILVGDYSGTIDYVSGVVEFDANYSGGSSVTARYIPTADVAQPAHTRQIPVTLATRGTVYAETLSPLPAPGTLIVDYRALGRWYRLRDVGDGVLVANDPSEGTGSIDYVTGACVVTLGALPDIDSAALFAWGSPAHYAVRAGATTDAAPTLRLDYVLAHAPIVPGTHVASYPVGGVVRTTTDSDGVISGTGVTGTINYATGAVRLQFSTPPDRAANLSNAYTWRDGADLVSSSGTDGIPVVSGEIDLSAFAPFRGAGQLRLNLADGIAAGGYLGTGGTVFVVGGTTQAGQYYNSQNVGVYNAATGIVTITNPVSWTRLTWNPGEGRWMIDAGTVAVVSAWDVRVERDTAAFDPNAITGETLAVSDVGLALDLTTTVADALVPGSLLFRATGKTYLDRNGALYADISPTTGSGTQAGSIDYATGVATLTWWADGVAVSRSVEACLTTYGNWTAIEAFFRTAGSPIRPASLYVQVTAADGELLTGTADQNGVITGAAMRGTVEQTMGVVAVEFGAEIDDVWTPREVMPGTLRYNCVVLTNLPLDAAILGLDPVRLPADGRVPIYRPGDVVVIHNTQPTALPNPVVAGATYNVGRTDLAVLRLEDANGVELAADRYVANPDTGTVTIAADWSGVGVAQPINAVHRIEDMALLADVQINGQIDLSAPTTHAYPVEGTYVSSALLYGDLQALVTTVFDQATWTGVWSDALLGSQSNAQYDDINYPIEVLNESAVTERWRIHFTSTTAFQIIGENLGVIATGSTAADCAPINPVTGEAYFVLRAAGWGAGWSAGNQLRFNTVGATGPTWIARTILAGAALAGDSFSIEARGDVD